MVHVTEPSVEGGKEALYARNSLTGRSIVVACFR